MTSDETGTTAAAVAAERGALRRTVALVAGLNVAYFAVEFGVARAIGSVALYADSIDFLEDASVNALVLLAMGFAAQRRKWAGIGFAGLLLVPSAAALWTVWEKISGAHTEVPEPFSLAMTAVGALVVNGTCALLLARVRHVGGSLSKAAFLSARNDVIANVVIIAAGITTAVMPSIWPDLVVGVAIAALNFNAACEVVEATRGETDID